jgi:sulfur carrier protein
MPSSIIIGTERIAAADGVTIERAVMSAGKHPDAFIFLLNGRPVPMTTILNGMEIEALRVASGG